MLRSGNAPLHVEVVTAAGSSQTDATAIPTNSSLALIVSAGDNTVGIRLPKAVKGKTYCVKNIGSGGLKVYPATGDAINAIVADTAITMLTVTSALFVAQNSTTWQTIPTVPS